MNLTGGIVLYAVIWFLTFFVALQIGVKTQGDVGVVVPGTPEGAPAEFNLRRKVIITTILTTLIWGILATVILSGWVTLEDIDWFGNLERRPPPTN